MMNFYDAQKKLLQYCQTWMTDQFLSTQNLPLSKSLGYCLAADIFARVDFPYEDISAMDGYALCFPENVSVAAKESQFNIVGESRAGEPYHGAEIKPGECISIMTGAVIPKNINTVVMRENVSPKDLVITLKKEINGYKNIRKQGEEIQKSQLLFSKGQQLTPTIISVLASQGIEKPLTFSPLKIAFFSSGDELCTADRELESGHIYESNLQSIHALLKSLPVDLHNLGIIPDNAEQIKSCLSNASKTNDIIISSGGVSVGDYDFIVEAVKEIGSIEHHKIAMKPGKPLCFGQINPTPKEQSNNSCLFFGLPGNPVSAFITLQEFFIPAIWSVSHCKTPPRKLRLNAELKDSIKKREGRTEFQRGLLSSEQTADGKITWQVSSLSTQDSHRLYSLSQANCYIILEQQCGNLDKGCDVIVEPLSWNFNV